MGRYVIPAISLSAMLVAGVAEAKPGSYYSKAETREAANYWITGALADQANVRIGLELSAPKIETSHGVGYEVTKDEKGDVVLPSGGTTNLELARKALGKGGWMSKLVNKNRSEIRALCDAQAHQFRADIQKDLPNNPKLCNEIAANEARMRSIMFDSKSNQALMPIDVSANQSGSETTYKMVPMEQGNLENDRAFVMRELFIGDATNQTDITLAEGLRKLSPAAEGKVALAMIDHGTNLIEDGVGYNNAEN
jgi:hypothetical protein